MWLVLAAGAALTDYSVVNLSRFLREIHFSRPPCLLLCGQRHGLLPLSFRYQALGFYNLRFHLPNQLSQLFLALGLGVGIDIPGMNFTIRPLW